MAWHTSSLNLKLLSRWRHDRRKIHHQLHAANHAAEKHLPDPFVKFARFRVPLYRAVFDLVQLVLGKEDGLEAIVRQQTTLPQDLTHGGRKQVLSNALRKEQR